MFYPINEKEEETTLRELVKAKADAMGLGYGFLVVKRSPRKHGVEIEHVPWHKIEGILVDLGAKGPIGGFD